jgi:hypothetical protein
MVQAHLSSLYSWQLLIVLLPPVLLPAAAADAWHERLVRYYTYFGFKQVHKVRSPAATNGAHTMNISTLLCLCCSASTFA